jgi:hypothetical protein
MNRQEMMLRAARGELADAAQMFLDKVDALEKLESLTEINTAVYESTDLCLGDATNALYFLIQHLEDSRR